MNQYINTLANEIVHQYIKPRRFYENKLIDKVRIELNEINSEQDQLMLLTIVLEALEIEFQKHQEDCDDPTCIENRAFQHVSYLLKQELREIGFQMNDDYFSSSEKENCNTKLDEILQTIINANEVVFDHVETLRTEIEELKNLYILGKKNWKQQFAGKMTDMTLSGVVSELTAKPLIEKVLSPSIEFIQNNLLD